MCRRTGWREEFIPPVGSRAALSVGRLRVGGHLSALGAVGKGRKKKNVVPDLPL